MISTQELSEFKLNIRNIKKIEFIWYINTRIFLIFIYIFYLHKYALSYQ